MFNEALPHDLLDLSHALQGTSLPNYFMQMHKSTFMFGISPSYGSVCTEPQNAGQLRVFTSGEAVLIHIDVSAATTLAEKGAGLRQIVTAVENIASAEQAGSVSGLRFQEIKPGMVVWTPPGGLVGIKPRHSGCHVVGLRRPFMRKSRASKAELLAVLSATSAQLQSNPPAQDVLQSVQQSQTFLEKCVAAIG